MTRNSREQERLARIRGSKMVECPVELLGRELRPLLDVEEAYENSLGNYKTIAPHRRYSVMEAGAALKTRSPLGAIFQLMLAADAGECLTDRKIDEFRQAREVAKLTSCLYSVAEFLEEHFGISRDDIGGDLALPDRFSPFKVSQLPIKQERDRAA